MEIIKGVSISESSIHLNKLRLKKKGVYVGGDFNVKLDDYYRFRFWYLRNTVLEIDKSGPHTTQKEENIKC